MNSSKKTRKLVLASVFLALIGVMTVVPYTGYISYSPMSIEITTLHLVVILGAIVLGPKYGALLGFFWGFTCFLRAFTNPAFILFTNPLISLVPRIFVGLAAGLTFSRLKRTKLSKNLAAAITAAVGTMTNTVLVLSAIYTFGGMIQGFAALYALFKQIIGVLITVNGAIELWAAVLLVPLIYGALRKSGTLPADGLVTA
ncbi:MAG: ECF transporter S component [Clostridiales bacterium]|nr:ECF transporter S component [Clostridiales bacterium]